jgi:hypothetical protein
VTDLCYFETILLTALSDDDDQKPNFFNMVTRKILWSPEKGGLILFAALQWLSPLTDAQN